MMMFLTSSILLGFIRLCFIILFLFYLNRKFVNVSRQQNFLDYIVTNWFRYAGALVIFIFVLVQVNAYNLFNCFFLLLLIIGIDLIGIENLKRPRHYFNFHIKASLLGFLRNIENKKTFWFWFSTQSPRKPKKKSFNLLLLILTMFIGGLTFMSRYYFIIYDNYSLSDAWITDLSRVIEFDNQSWFNSELVTDGELALVNFYGKITDVSPEIALQVIAILESTILSIMIFWTIHKLSPSKFLAPVIASLSFSTVYVLTPLNVYFLLKGNPTFLALTFALPLFVYYLKPNLLKVSRISFFISQVILIVTIGLIDLFTLCILIPPFLLIGFIFTRRKEKLQNLFSILSYFVAFGILYVIYGLASYIQQVDIFEYLQSNLLSVDSYTYVPQLIFPYELIIRYTQYSTFIGFALILLLIIFKKAKGRNILVFFVYFNFLILLTYIKSEWLDTDLLNNSLSVFLPIILGFNASIIIRIFNLVLERYERFTPITVTVLIAAILYSAVYYQRKNINSLTVSDQTPKQILDAYDKISQTFFQFSYAVVNDPATQVISTNKHFFVNYDFFLEDYPRIDSVYFRHRKNPKFFVKNPEYSLPQSVLVFVLDENGKAENNIFSENKQLNASLDRQLDLLKSRGRKINLFYNSDILKVYEIVNQPQESKISDLIF